MIMRLPVIVQFSFKCGICMQVQMGDVQECFKGHMMAEPTLPTGWRLLEAMTICPRHDVKIKIDEEEFPFWGDRY